LVNSNFLKYYVLKVEVYIFKILFKLRGLGDQIFSCLAFIKLKVYLGKGGILIIEAKIIKNLALGLLISIDIIGAENAVIDIGN